MNFSRWLPVFILTLVVNACEKPIDFSPRNPEPKLVVEGVIENDQYPLIYLSRSLNYFSNISLADLAGSFVRNAEMTLSDGTVTYPLVEYTLPVADGYSIYFYSFDTTGSSAFRGEAGKKYDLLIKVDGSEYTASTTIPQLTKTLDSLYYMENVDDEDSSKVVLYGKFSDPAGYGNYTRYFTSANGGSFLPGLASVYDDQVIDGTSYKIQIEQGVDRNSEIDFEDYSYFYKGDDIVVKFCNIDKGVFDFWRTMEYSYSSIGNPFSSPTKIIGNVSNGALGYFGGYAVQYVSIAVPQ